MALLMLCERLTAPERAVLILHDAFGYRYQEIARILGRSEAACRQLRRRAAGRLGPLRAGQRGATRPDRPPGSPAWPARHPAGDAVTKRRAAQSRGHDSSNSTSRGHCRGGPGRARVRGDGGPGGRRTRFALGLDDPLYLSPHTPSGRLAPDGYGLVHVMRYGTRTAAEDRAQLRAAAEACGIGQGDIVVERFLPRMVVVTKPARPRRGAGRTAAGRGSRCARHLRGRDWVGAEGWLSDCSLASGEKAGQLAARTAHGQRGARRPSATAART